MRPRTCSAPHSALPASPQRKGTPPLPARWHLPQWPPFLGSQASQLKSAQCPTEDEDSRRPERSRGRPPRAWPAVSPTPRWASVEAPRVSSLQGAQPVPFPEGPPLCPPTSGARPLGSSRFAHTPQALWPSVPVPQHAGTFPLQEGVGGSLILASQAQSDMQLALKTSVSHRTGRRWRRQVSPCAGGRAGPGPSRGRGRRSFLSLPSRARSPELMRPEGTWELSCSLVTLCF